MKEEAIGLFHKVLRDSKYSTTQVRTYVFDLLWGREPQSMPDLTAQARNSIDRASLYRTIKLFERLGIAQRLYIGWKYKIELSDVFAHHHHHLGCLVCGKIIAIKENDEIERLIESLASRNNMTLERHQLEIQGYCQKCRTLRAT